MLTDKDLYRMSDGELASALFKFSQSEIAEVLLRNQWEKDFAKGIEEAYVRYGKLTWKQRKSAREIVWRFIERANRRLEVRS